MFQSVFDFIGKGAILIINVEYVIRHIIISNVNIWPPVFIDIGDTDTQAVTFHQDPSLERYIRKCVIAIVTIQAIVVQCRAVQNSRPVVAGYFIAFKVRQHIQIEIAIFIIIEECGVLTVSRIGYTILIGFIVKCWDSPGI